MSRLREIQWRRQGAPARKIFSSPSLEIFSPFLETKSQKENPPCNVI